MQSSFRNELVNIGLIARFAGNVRKRSGIITDLVEPWRVGTTSGATIVRDAPSHWQESVNSSTSADYVYYTLDARLKITLPLTFTFWFKSLGTSATGGTVAGVIYDTGITHPYLCWAIGLENPNQRFRLMSNNGSFQTDTSSVDSSAFTTWTHVCATITSGKRIVWVNGKEVINTTGHGNPSYSSTSYLCLGEPGANTSNCRVADFKLFASEFNTGRACADMLAGRLQFPGERDEFPYYLVGESVADTTGVLAGSTTLTYSTTGTTVANGVLSGTTSLTFSTTGNIQATGALSGASDLSFTDIGNLLGSGVLAGPTTLAFITTGVLSSGTELAGSTTLTFTTTGALVGVGALAASSTLTFSTTGVSVGVGVLNASTTVDFSTSGLINGIAACVANTTLDFSTTGLLGGTGTLLGNSSISFSLTGDLALGLVGSTSLAFTLTGNVVGIGAISGSSSLTFGISGGFAVDETGVLMDASPNIFWFGTIV